MNYYFFEITPGNVAYTQSLKAVPVGQPYVEGPLPERPAGNYRLAMHNGTVEWVHIPTTELHLELIGLAQEVTENDLSRREEM